MTHHRRLLAALAPLIACDPAGPTVLAGQHVDLVIRDPSLEPCGDVVGHLDRFIELMADRWHIDLTGVRFSYDWYVQADYLATAECPDRTTGCARDQHARAYVAPMDHEVAHIVSFELGHPPPFFTEGAAVAFELPLTLSSLQDRPGDAAIVDVLTGPLASEHYPLAGAYTRFLIDRHGLPAYLDLFASLDRDADADEIAATHADLFGEPLQATIAAFDAERRDCDFARFNFKLFECSGEPLAWAGDVLTTRRDLGCDAPDVIGPFVLDHVSRLYMTFVVDTPGLFDLSIAGDPGGVGLTVASCGGCGSPAPLTLRLGGGPVRLGLAAGQYYLLLTGPLTQPAAAAIRLARVE